MAAETQEEKGGRIGWENVISVVLSGMAAVALMDPSLSTVYEERPTKKYRPENWTRDSGSINSVLTGCIGNGIPAADRGSSNS